MQFLALCSFVEFKTSNHFILLKLNWCLQHEYGIDYYCAGPNSLSKFHIINRHMPYGNPDANAYEATVKRSTKDVFGTTGDGGKKTIFERIMA